MQNTILDVRQITSSGNPDTVTFRFTPTAARLFGVGISGTIGVTSIALAGYYTYTVTLVPSTVVSTVCSEDEYRYDFNTQMKTNEWAGVGNHTTALYWEYDSRTGRRANIDPKYRLILGLSPYSTNKNNPHQYHDKDGDNPALIGFFFGVINEYVGQVVGNYIGGKTGIKALSDVDVWDVLANGAASAIGGLGGAALGVVTKSIIDIKPYSNTYESPWGFGPYNFTPKSGKDIVIDAGFNVIGEFFGAAGKYYGAEVSKSVGTSVRTTATHNLLIKTVVEEAVNSAIQIPSNVFLNWGADVFKGGDKKTPEKPTNNNNSNNNTNNNNTNNQGGKSPSV